MECEIRPDTLLTLTPSPATIIVTKVCLEILSFNKILAKKALINGIEARMKSVAATVVLVIACIKHIPAEASKVPARVPDQPTSVIFLNVFLWYLKRRIKRIVSESASPLYRVI